MKKKVLALISAAAITMMNSMPVLAANSPSVGTVNPPASGQFAITVVSDCATPEVYAKTTAPSGGYTVSQASATTVASANVAVQNQIMNNLATIGNFLGDPSLVAAAGNPTSTVSAAILSTVEVKASSATKGADGTYTVGLANAAIAAGDRIVILHYNGSFWEVIKPVSVTSGLVIFNTISLSPISVVKIQGGVPVDNTSGSNGTTNPINPSGNTPVSPRTGRTLPLAAALLVLFAGCAVYCGKKYFS